MEVYYLARMVKIPYNLLTIRTSDGSKHLPLKQQRSGFSSGVVGHNKFYYLVRAIYQNGYFLIRAGAASLYSVDGITYAVVNSVVVMVVMV